MAEVVAVEAFAEASAAVVEVSKTQQYRHKGYDPTLRIISNQ